MPNPSQNSKFVIALYIRYNEHLQIIYLKCNNTPTLHFTDRVISERHINVVIDI